MPRQFVGGFGIFGNVRLQLNAHRVEGHWSIICLPERDHFGYRTSRQSRALNLTIRVRLSATGISAFAE